MISSVISRFLRAEFSLFGKILILLALVTALISGIVNWNAKKMLFDEAVASIALLAVDATLATSMQVAGALKFRKTDTLTAALQKLKSRSDGRFLGGFVLDATLQDVVIEGNIAPEIADKLRSLAKTAIEERSLSTAAAGMLVAAPVMSPDDTKVVGVVAFEWSATGAIVLINEKWTRGRNFAIIAFLIVFAASALFLNSTFRRPIKKLETAMALVAGGDLDAANPLAERKDEIGTLAKALNVMRENLAKARLAEHKRQESAHDQSQIVNWLSKGLQQLATGKLNCRLTQEFPSDYTALKDDFNAATQHLTTAVVAVVQAGNQIDSVAQAIHQQSENLATRTENQAATLEQTAAALDELTGHVKNAAQSTQQIDLIVRQAEIEAVQTNSIVVDSVAAMKEIEVFSKQISAIIGVIDDISFQTNLLALNAGVEAARAGEAGRGFAVVASEVGSLAQKSSDAAREIKTLINSSSMQVSKGVERVDHAGVALKAIVERVKSIALAMKGISEGATMQASGLTEINVGMRQLDQVTQHNAAMVVEAGNVAGQLAKEVAALKQSVASFDLENESLGDVPALFSYAA